MAKTFKDAAGRTWTVEITVDTIKRVRTVLDTDLLDAAAGDLLRDLALDPVRVVDILYVILEEQTKDQGVSDTDFGKAMDGDVIDAAVDSFLDALINFFPRRQRAIMREVLDKATLLQDRVLAAVQKRTQGPELEKVVDRVLNQQFDQGLRVLETPGNSYTP